MIPDRHHVRSLSCAAPTAPTAPTGLWEACWVDGERSGRDGLHAPLPRCQARVQAGLAALREAEVLVRLDPRAPAMGRASQGGSGVCWIYLRLD